MGLGHSYEECGSEGLRLFLRRLSSGLNVGGLAIKAFFRKGRIQGLYVGEVSVGVDWVSNGQPICSVMVFCGRGAYRPWIEIFSCSGHVEVGGRRVSFTGDGLEDALLDLSSSSLSGGQPLYFEYVWDYETLKEVSQGVHPAFTRIGWKMLCRGFTWFKLWYYPEGFMEGSEKIQAEKPVTLSHMERHLAELREEAARLALSSLSSTAASRASAFLKMAGRVKKPGDLSILCRV